MLEEIYGYKVGEIVEAKVDLVGEYGFDARAGTRLKLLSFPPKVRIVKDDQTDGKHYFSTPFASAAPTNASAQTFARSGRLRYENS